MLNALRRFFSGGERPAAPAAPPRPALDVKALLEPAAAAWRAGDLDGAERLLDAAIERHHDVAEVHLMLGRLQHARGRYDDARDSFVLAAAFNPQWWQPLFQIGLLALDQNRCEEALAPLHEAVSLGADDARVHNTLGAAYLNLDRAEEAVEQFRRAIQMKPDFVEAHSNLGYTLFRDCEQYEEGTRHIETALALAPEHVAVLCNWSMVLHYRNLTEEALALCVRLLADDPECNEARLNRALMLLKMKRFGLAWADYEARKSSPRHKFPKGLPWPEWDGMPLAGRTLFVYGEQGLGDEIMFASCLPDLAAAGARVVVECTPKLAALYRRSFPWATVLEKNAWKSSPELAQRPPDCQIAIGSLPRFYRNELGDFPDHRGYLHADAARVEHWREVLARLPGRRKIGLSWKGGLASTRRTLRSIPLEELLPVLRVADIDFVSLQYTDCAEELAALQAEHGIAIHHWQAAIDDYDETAALACALDLVISVQTAVVHLAGALGRPVWALIPAAPEWRYAIEGESMPWYPSVRLFRQSDHAQWGPVVRRVADELTRPPG